MAKAIVIDKTDNTATLFGEVRAGGLVSIVGENGETLQEIIARQDIPVGHKIALREIGEGEKVIKYGEIIGVTTQKIQRGGHVHVQNVVSGIFPGEPISSNPRVS